MKNLIKTVILVATVVMLALTPAMVQAADTFRADGSPVLSYVGATRMFSKYGTNSTAGWTNSLRIVDLKDKRLVGIQVQYQGADASTTNIVLVGKYLYDTGNTNVATAGTGATFRNTIVSTGTTKVVALTNIVDVAHPYLALGLEQLADLAAITNVTVKVWTK
jgi:hypothetical protein